MSDKMSKQAKDISNQAEVAAIKQKAKSADETFKEDMVWLMGNPRGRRLMMGFISACHVFETSFDTNLSKTNFNEGERNIGLQLLSGIMDNTPDQYMRMIEENKQ